MAGPPDTGVPSPSAQLTQHEMCLAALEACAPHIMVRPSPLLCIYLFILMLDQHLVGQVSVSVPFVVNSLATSVHCPLAYAQHERRLPHQSLRINIQSLWYLCMSRFCLCDPHGWNVCGAAFVHMCVCVGKPVTKDETTVQRCCVG
jgi:hypothetical protein